MGHPEMEEMIEAEVLHRVDEVVSERLEAMKTTRIHHVLSEYLADL